MKHCIDCKFHEMVGAHHGCARPPLSRDMVSGRRILNRCLQERDGSYPRYCGYDGGYFEPKPPLPKKPWYNRAVEWLRKKLTKKGGRS